MQPDPQPVDAGRLIIAAPTDGVPYLNEAEYRSYMDLIMSQVRTLRLVPVARMRDLVGRAEALGPILDTTAYQRGGANNLRDQSEILAAVAALVAVADRIEARAGVRR